MTLPAIAARPGSTEPTYVDPPKTHDPGPGEVLCRTLEVGICGTDREILKGKKPSKPSGADYLILGHECLAVIEKVGAGVTDFAPGDLVAPTVRRPRDRGDHRMDMMDFRNVYERGIHQMHGFTMPYFNDDPKYLVKVPPELRGVAVLAEPISVTEKGINEALIVQKARMSEAAWGGAKPPRVLVTGQGPIAFAGIIGCVARGWPVTMLGRDRPDSFRSMLAAEFGATYMPQDDFPFPDRQEVEETGFDLVLECTGAEEVLIQASLAVRCDGVVVWLGAPGHQEARPLNLGRMMRDTFIKNIIHLGSVNAAMRDFRDALNSMAAVLKTHPQAMAKVITRRVAADDRLSAYGDRDKQSVKVILTYGDDG